MCGGGIGNSYAVSDATGEAVVKVKVVIVASVGDEVGSIDATTEELEAVV